MKTLHSATTAIAVVLLILMTGCTVPASVEEPVKEVDSEAVIIHDEPVSSAEKPAPMPAEKKMMRTKSTRSITGIAMGAYMPHDGLPSSGMYRDDFNTESYSKIDEGGFKSVSAKPLSTFSIDVDTASYSNMRRFINSGMTPPKDSIRIEEMINYFSYDYPGNNSGEPFSIYTELSKAPWNEKHKLLHIGLKGREINWKNTPPRNLVFLLDVSGSMESPDKLPLLKKGMKMLTEQLREQDSVSIVVYAGASGVVLPPTNGSNKQKILSAIESQSAGGSTNGAEGIVLAYDLAKKHFKKDGINRVILATDGDFNVGVTSHGDLMRLIEEKRNDGIFLTVLGFGTGNLKDSTMEALADRGNGNYGYIDSVHEAKKVLVKEAGSTLVTIAKDVKIQIEFNPAHVSAYRLVGYENRRLADEDFNDDKKDAGEIGAGHTVTALYEIIPAGEKVPSGVDPLKYQTVRNVSSDAKSDELLTLKIRHKDPRGDKSKLISTIVSTKSKELKDTSDNFRFSASVAAFGMTLRDSEFKGKANYEMVRNLAKGALGDDPEGYRSEFVSLVSRAKDLVREN